MDYVGAVPQFLTFCSSVWSHWKVNLTGGSLIAALFLWQVTHEVIPGWAYLGIAIITLFISCFLVWSSANKARAQAEQRTEQEKVRTDEQIVALAAERELRIKAERALADEKANKLAADEIVLRESSDGFRNLVKSHHNAVPPRHVLNDAWVRQVAAKYGRREQEIDEAISRLDGARRFHWQA